jgi:hypothetical protein
VTPHEKKAHKVYFEKNELVPCYESVISALHKNVLFEHYFILVAMATHIKANDSLPYIVHL